MIQYATSSAQDHRLHRPDGCVAQVLLDERTRYKPRHSHAYDLTLTLLRKGTEKVTVVGSSNLLALFNFSLLMCPTVPDHMQAVHHGQQTPAKHHHPLAGTFSTPSPSRTPSYYPPCTDSAGTSGHPGACPPPLAHTAAALYCPGAVGRDPPCFTERHPPGGSWGPLAAPGGSRPTRTTCAVHG